MMMRINIMHIGQNMVTKYINMGRKRHKHKKSSFELLTESVELNPDKFVIIKEAEGQYAIFNNINEGRIMIKRVKDTDDEYAFNSIVEILNYLQLEI